MNDSPATKSYVWFWQGTIWMLVTGVASLMYPRPWLVWLRDLATWYSALAFINACRQEILDKAEERFETLVDKFETLPRAY